MATQIIHSVTILDETVTFTLEDLSQTTNIQAELIKEMVEQGLLEPQGEAPEQWLFPVSALQRSRTVVRLQRDLGVNVAGSALVLELLEQIEELRAQLELLKHRNLR